MNPPPPPVPDTYDPNDALNDIPGIHWALHEFLHSRMLESEEYFDRIDPNKCVVRTGLCVLQLKKSRQGEAVFRDGLWTHSVCQGSYVIRGQGTWHDFGASYGR